uniref:Flavonoid-6-hydroxylase n=1 Tax=Scutellaria baicalensis TaxID=65409 RepID=A0A286RS92_SCUBA|nr:cytochrome P450 CYP82D2 [Scutellaria baicalensis]
MLYDNSQYLAMEFSSAIYGAIAFFLFLYYCLLYTTSSKPNTRAYKAPPEAGGARLFSGHLHLMAGGTTGELPHINLANLADKHGPVFTIRLGVKRALVVSSWESAKELFTTCDVAVSSRPRMKAAKLLGYDFAMFGFAPYGAYWRELRKLISVELLSTRRMELQKEVRDSETRESIKELYKLWEERSEGSDSVLVDMKQWFGDLNLNVVLRMVAGKRWIGPETGRWREVLRDFFYLAGMFVPADAFPFLGWLDLGGHEKRMRQTAKELDGIVGGWVAEHREKEYSGEDKPKDFVDVMLSVVQGSSLRADYDADTIIKATCEALIVGGSDTTTVMLIWTLSFLLNNRHVLRKAQEELDKHVGRERRVNQSDINNLVYLQAIVKETLRLYPAGPIGGIREFTQDCQVGGYHVPKGTWLIVNLWKLHRDPKVWSEDCLEFRPERFLNKNIDVRGQDFELIPFGGGRRICPGANFGLHMLHLVLANLLQAFELTTVSDQVIDMTESAGMTNMKATPLNVLVAPRLSPTLY